LDLLARPAALRIYSLGGRRAFEVARELERRGVSPRHVFVSGCRPPHRVLTGAPLPEGDDALVEDVDERYGAVPPAVRAEPELLRRFVPVLRADLELAAAYEWDGGERLACPLTETGLASGLRELNRTPIYGLTVRKNRMPVVLL
jgi:surfactin synthase thioesterase subunit